ncbi:hypothetical protein HanPSC8_Chr02g0054711 [Helianthus annuus]|nr:hypothetical protein HanPSC8_Chr02g0054711 [Helianthus annuus]
MLIREHRWIIELVIIKCWCTCGPTSSGDMYNRQCMKHNLQLTNAPKIHFLLCAAAFVYSISM